MTLTSMSELRGSFLSFMEQRKYQHIKADYLISEAFPTTFNVSGGPNFAEQYLDKSRPEGEACATIQHCVRHWDYENAGDGLHLSFFEMGVTTAFDDFPQHRLFRDHLDFILHKLEFPKDSLHVNVFGGGYVRGEQFEADQETEETWLSLGIDEQHIYRIPQEVPEEIANRLRNEKGSDAVEREAFVANAVEPVGGPRTEIFIDRGGPNLCKPKCLPGFCNCGRYVEFWTSVHYTTRVTPVTHERDIHGEQLLAFEPLQPGAKIYAAAFGLERVMQIALNKSNIYDFAPLSEITALVIERVGAALRQSQMRHVWGIADHLRGLTFLILEGAPHLFGKLNRSRKYQYRRYLKSLHSHFDALGLDADHSFIKRLVDQVVSTHLTVFPYKELYNELYIDTGSIAQDITARLQNLSIE